MRYILPLLIGLATAACTPAAPDGYDFSKADIGVLPGCPAIPGINSVRIVGKDGPDFRLCKATEAKTGKPLFDVYVGEHPALPERGFRFAGTTSANGKMLIWFAGRPEGPGTPSLWYTFLATGSPRGTVMMVTFQARNGDRDLEQMGPLVAHLVPSL